MTLRIIRPRHDDVFIGAEGDGVAFEGTEVTRDAISEGRPMFYRWYSNHHATRDQYSLNEPAFERPDQPFRASLCVGSHAIVFAAMDKPSDRKGVFEQVTDGGVTGGTAGDGACVVHVLRAKILGVFPAVAGGGMPPLPAVDWSGLPVALTGGMHVGVMAAGPLMWKDFEPGYIDLRYTLALEHHDAAGVVQSEPPPHVFEVSFTYADADRGGHHAAVAWGVVEIPHFDDPTHWYPTPGLLPPDQRETHLYNHLVLGVEHRGFPGRVHRERTPVELTRPLPLAPAEE